MTLTIFLNARILHPATATIVEGGVVVEGNTIREVSEGRVRVGPGARVIDLGGRVLMPGLIDAHVHVMAATTDLARLARMPASLVTARAKPTLEAMLRRGFTAVRDAGGADWGLAEAVRRGWFAGPRLFISGLGLAQSGGMGDFRERHETHIGCPCCHSMRSISRVADGVDEVRRVTRDELRKGASQIKIFAGGGIAGAIPVDRDHFSMEELQVAVAEASAAGTYVMAHAYAAGSIRRAVAAGVRTIEHGNLVDAATAAFMAEKGAFMVPTLAVYEGYHRHARELGVAEHRIDGISGLLQSGQQALETCRRAGVAMGFGSDLEGLLQPYHEREFALRGEVAPPAEIIASATTVNARILQMEGKLGVVAPGALADLIVVDGNPLERLDVLQQEGRGVPLVMQDGVVVKDELGHS